MLTWRTAYMLSEENCRHSVLHCAGDSSTTSAGRSGHSDAATRSKPALQLAEVSWLLLDALSEACSITAVSTTEDPSSCEAARGLVGHPSADKPAHIISWAHATEHDSLTTSAAHTMTSERSSSNLAQVH